MDVIEETLPDGSRIRLVPSESGLDLPADEWSDWGERLPLEMTAGKLHRALVVRVEDGVGEGVDDSTGDQAAPDPDDVRDRALAELSWHRVSYGANSGSQAWNIGIGVRPEFRGQGIGSAAQRLLARYLFATTVAVRVEAGTDVRNVAEQRALERAGFRREGVLRASQYRGGEYHDMVSYSLLRGEC